jgi:hypothetical protein
MKQKSSNQYNLLVRLKIYILGMIALSTLLIPIYIHSEEGIYLPFPDLPKEILEPSQSSIEPLKTNKSEINRTKPIEENSKILPDEKPAKKEVPIVDGRINSKSKQSISKQKKANLKSKKSKNSDAKKKTISIARTQKSSSTSGIEEPNLEYLPIAENDFATDEDKIAFQKSMETIRAIETKDKEKASVELIKLLDKYSSVSLQTEILLNLAMNYYHRSLYLQSLEYLIRILENEEAIETKQYPTALYLAGEIHERPWYGQNSNYAQRYYRIYLLNVESGKKNFTENLYIPTVKQKIKALNYL